MNTPERGLAWHNDIFEGMIDRLQVDPNGMATAVGDDNPARHVVRHFADLLRNRRRLTLAELEQIEAVGGVRAAAGRPVDDVLCDLRAAMAASWHYLVSLVPPAAPPEAAVDALARLADEALDFAQRAVEAVAQGHAAGTRLDALGRRPAPRVDPFDSASELAHLLEPTRRHGVIVFTLPATAGDDPAPLAASASAFTAQVGGVGGVVRSAPAMHAPVAVTADESAWAHVVALAEATAKEHGAVVLATAPTGGSGSAYDAYREVAALVPMAREVGRGGRADDLSVYRFVAGTGPDEARAFVRRVLGGLLDLPDDEVTTLLDRLDADPNARRRVEEQTGLALDQPFDRMRLDTAAVLRRHDWVPRSP
ncbi:MAG TPA: hypothetical protein VM938_03015 [Acidimicrobiales bacterium]|nr:hypothetical protein [Acidimicrobiales bacterium]